MNPQKRGRRIAMTDPERDAYLAEQRTCRVATVGPKGVHVTPLWFLWDGVALWLYSLTGSQRWADVVRSPAIAVVIDDGHDYLELRGVEITGEAEVVGEAPRVGEDVPELVNVESSFAGKYFGIDELPYDRKHGWLRVQPTSIRSWDFRKIGA
ncbi:MAG: pyridoxamine 5'-phosphate oxidase family protein [Nocardiaceae bacterium]|nr:pyridoxamine 5'-phosphate oxidase family protein [Nocardiaceae bacterium]